MYKLKYSYNNSFSDYLIDNYDNKYVKIITNYSSSPIYGYLNYITSSYITVLIRYDDKINPDFDEISVINIPISSILKIKQI